MSQARTNARKRKQAVQNMNHLAPRQRPNYKKRQLGSVADAIAAERRKAAREAASRKKKT